MLYLLVVPVTGPERRIALLPGRLRIGRSADNDVVLDSSDISRHHAEVDVEFDRAIIRDLGSVNGLVFGAQRVSEATLRDGDTVWLGAVRITVGRALSTPGSAGGSSADVHGDSASGARASIELSGTLVAGLPGAGSRPTTGAVEGPPLDRIAALAEQLTSEGASSPFEERVLRAAMIYLGARRGRFLRIDDDPPQLLAGLGEGEYTGGPPIDLLRAAAHDRRILCLPGTTGGEESWIVPLRQLDADLGVLCLDSPAREGEPDRQERLGLRVLAQLLGLLAGLERLHRELADDGQRLREQRDFLQKQIAGQVQPLEMVAEAPSMRRALEQLDRVAASLVTVLVCGETGTGKELAARRLHSLSPRADGPFVPVNCGAIPPTLIESTLFGIEKGVATGVERQSGVFELAHCGTLFLDEVGELPLDVQAKFLRVLEERSVTPIGARQPKPVDVRIVTATHRDLRQMVATGGFRRDLYYRLGVVEVALPPLRDRPEDLLALARRFLAEFGRRDRKPVRGVTMGAAQALRQYAWPGNVRELRNVIERAVVLRRGDLISEDDLPADLVAPARREEAGPRGEEWLEGTWSEARERLERLYFARLMRECRGKVTDVAQRSGINRRNVYEKIERHGLGTGVGPEV